MQSALFLNVVIGQAAFVLQLLAGEYEPLLVGWYALLVLNFLLDRVDRIGGFDIESESFSGERFHEDLHGNAKRAKTVVSVTRLTFKFQTERLTTCTRLDLVVFPRDETEPDTAENEPRER